MIFTIVAFVFFGNNPASPSVAAGDEEYARLNYPAADSIYQSILQQLPRDPDVLWRLARLYVCMGDVAEDNEREELYRRAESYARDCIRVDAKKGEGHTGLAAALGSIAYYTSDPVEKVRLSQEIKQELDRALQLNPQDDMAYSILGSFYRALGNTSWFERQLARVFLGEVPEGGYEEAEMALKHAIALAPGVMRNYYELGVLYLDWQRGGDARRAFTMALQQPILQASDREKIKRIHEFFADLQASK